MGVVSKKNFSFKNGHIKSLWKSICWLNNRERKKRRRITKSNPYVMANNFYYCFSFLSFPLFAFVVSMRQFVKYYNCTRKNEKILHLKKTLLYLIILVLRLRNRMRHSTFFSVSPEIVLFDMCVIKFASKVLTSRFLFLDKKTLFGIYEKKTLNRSFQGL